MLSLLAKILQNLPNMWKTQIFEKTEYIQWSFKGAGVAVFRIRFTQSSASVGWVGGGEGEEMKNPENI